MARLRKDEEARKYERMVNPSSVETFARWFPNSPYTYILAENNRAAADQEDDITYAEVNRQLALIFNILVSIVACGIAIWIAARHWSIPQRLALSMTGAIVVGVAEVVIYTGYIRRLGEARTKERAKKELVTIESSWVIEGKTSSREGHSSTARLREKGNKSDKIP
jgi:hypothetical protein